MSSSLEADNINQEYDMLIIGAGFSGMYQLYRLREEGFKVKVLEAGSDLGGVWHWNTYPGARVDCHVPNYEFSMEELWRDWSWEERYPSWKELQKYYKHINQTLDLLKDIVFNSRVVSSTFDENTSQWKVYCEDGKTYRSKFILPCTGYASKPIYPDIPGLNSFSGVCIHTSRWDNGLDDKLKDKRIAVIGTGASGVQVIQELHDEASEMFVFQRTPNIAFPMRQKDLSKNEQSEMKEYYPKWFEQRATSVAGLHDVAPDPRVTNDLSSKDIKEVLEEAWLKGGLHLLSPFSDTLIDKAANLTAYKFWREKVFQRVVNPDIAEQLAPESPPHPYGVKRPSLEQGYFEAFNKSTVKLIDIKTDPILEITTNGIKTESSFYEVDVIILATGFDSNTGGLTQIDFKGTSAISLKDKWSTQVNTYLGIGIPDYPNLLMLYGPQSPAAFWNGPASAEIQGEWVVELLKHMKNSEYKRIDTINEAAQGWTERLHAIATHTLISQADSWYMGANVPGKPRQLLNHFGVKGYVEACKACKDSGYDGFKFS